MQFTSLTFAFFLPAVFVLYWLLGKVRSSALPQNLVLIVASYAFYAAWDRRALLLLVAMSVIGYASGWALERTDGAGKRKAILVVTLVLALAILGFFKYFNFFLDSFGTLLNSFGLGAPSYALRILLPVGLSFYTFQMLTYPLDIYRRQMHATRDVVAYAAFTSFFAQLTAGPIGRAQTMLPQYQHRRQFDDPRAREGLRQILWGLTKKVLIADNLAPLVNAAFAGYSTMSSINLFFGAFFFAIQLYADFSGYSDIAIGIGKLFGLELPMNFSYPYFSRSIGEFWRRWHISLSFWVRDYVYIPLGGNRVPKARRIFNVLVSFFVIGLWHGANWTFIVWGLLNGLYQVPVIIRGRKVSKGIVAEGRLLPGLRDAAAILGTFLLTMLAWVFFRADSVAQALGYLERFLTGPVGPLDSGYVPYIFLCLGLLIVEWLLRSQQFALAGLRRFPVPLRWATYCVLLLVLLVFVPTATRQFVYVQF